MEGDRVIRISGSGTFSYTSGGETVLSVESAGGLPTPREAVFGVLELLDQLIPEGDARLYLLEWQQSETATFLTFGYQSGGVPIRFADGSAAAEVTLSGNTISALSPASPAVSALPAPPRLCCRCGRLWPSPGGQRGPSFPSAMPIPASIRSLPSG